MTNPNYDRQVQDVRSASDIVAVVQEYVPLQRKGRSYWANCPFHKEKTPSFSVNPEKQLFKCFGCGEGGDAFSFVMKYDGVDFPEALKILAARAGIQLQQARRSPAQEKAKKTLFDVNEWAAKTYHKWLVSAPSGKEALKYFSDRQIGMETVKRLGLGWAPAKWDALRNEAGRARVPEKMLIEAGLVIENDEGRRYDRFRGRVLFPILDAQGRAVGFGGRVIGDGEPKYLNSPETEVYSKGRVLYHAERAKLAMRETRRAIVVEGYMDAIVAHEHGFTETVAVLGTALTPEHVRFLKRFVDEAVIVFDGDEAGVRSANRSLESFAQEELAARVCVLPDGLDPCDCLQQRGRAFFEDCLGAAPDGMTFRLRSATSVAGGSGLDKARAVDEAIELVAQMPNPVMRSFGLERISTELNVPIGALRERFDALARRARRGEVAPERKLRKRDAEAELIEVMLNYPEVIPWVQNEIDLDMFRSEPAHHAAAVIFHLADDGAAVAPEEVLIRIEDQASRDLVGRLAENRVGRADSAEWARQLVSRIRSRTLLEEARLIREDIRHKNAEDDALLHRYLERKRLAQGLPEADEAEEPEAPPEEAPNRDWDEFEAAPCHEAEELDF